MQRVAEFASPGRVRPPLPKAPRADNAPIEGMEARTNMAGGFDQGAREMRALSMEEIDAALAGRSNATRAMLAAPVFEEEPKAPVAPAEADRDGGGPGEGDPRDGGGDGDEKDSKSKGKGKGGKP